MPLFETDGNAGAGASSQNGGMESNAGTMLGLTFTSRFTFEAH